MALELQKVLFLAPFLAPRWPASCERQALQQQQRVPSEVEVTQPCFQPCF